ncbi:uncharacterized protein LOC111266793 [Varroa jacobsoni]|uniref:uncharacterized protein LOC111266793 n=1 Tax=Varroa jacobsoni TaxID=62625 RepID=UPI000BF7289D|nr:uncharacterized protein LOC111266793 [Varroa jacobsoni]
MSFGRPAHYQDGRALLSSSTATPAPPPAGTTSCGARAPTPLLRPKRCTEIVCCRSTALRPPTIDNDGEKWGRQAEGVVSRLGQLVEKERNALIENELSRQTSKSRPGLTRHKANKFEKFLLVYFKKYPLGQVPDLVPQHQMEKVRDMARIRINIYMCIATFLGAIGAVWIGKKQHSEGVSLHKINLDWHNEIKKDTKIEKAKDGGGSS